VHVSMFLAHGKSREKSCEAVLRSCLFFISKLCYASPMSLQISSAKFMRGVAGTDELLGDGTPQVAFVGRSNVGKSSIINSLTRAKGPDGKGLARTSNTPGMTQQINIYLINNSLYLFDLPGYGYAKASPDTKERIQKLIYWYLYDSGYPQKKVVLVIDANVGPTEFDMQMLRSLQEHQKPILIVANKVDKIKKSEYEAKLATFAELPGNPRFIPYSSEAKIGIEELTKAILE
jgi:GTP-binding protein